MLTINIKPSRPQTAPLAVFFMGPLQLDCCNSAVQLFDSVENSELEATELPFKAS